MGARRNCRVLLQRTFLCAIAATGSFLVAARHPPTPSATFQIEVNYVDIDAVVTDARGNFVGDLMKDDFELLDDGKPQEIDAFSLLSISVPTGLSRAYARSPPCSQRRQVQRATYQRAFVHNRARRPERQPLSLSKVVVGAARGLIERHLGPGDAGWCRVPPAGPHRRRSGIYVGARIASRRHRQVPGAQAKIHSHRKRQTDYFQQHLKELGFKQIGS